MFIVFEEQLLELLISCPKCSSVAMVQLKQTVGSMVRFQQDCGICGYNRLWQSQPMSAAILFSGM
jgi:ribosomal protein S27AE